MMTLVVVMLITGFCSLRLHDYGEKSMWKTADREPYANHEKCLQIFALNHRRKPYNIQESPSAIFAEAEAAEALNLEARAMSRRIRRD